LQWTDSNGNSISEPSERVFTGFADYPFTGNEGDNVIIGSSLENFNNPGDPVIMEGGKGYIAIVEYQAINADDPRFFILASEARDYRPQQLAMDTAFAHGLTDMPAFFSVLGTSPDGILTNIDYEVKELDLNDNRIFFGNNIVPVVRIVTSEKGCFDGVEVLSSAEKISVFPNPASEMIQVKMDFTSQQQDVHLRLINNLGQPVMSRALPASVIKHTEKIDVRHLLAGSYQLHVETPEGNRSIPVVILH